ncbi:MAG: hypothetical protein JSS61_04750 [Verrucomicrobia bacterium]|nr:hypothetical protein [Verrucomicrobiota bacterium]
MSIEMQPPTGGSPNNKGAFIDANGFLVKYEMYKCSDQGKASPLALNSDAEKLIKEKVPDLLQQFESEKEIEKSKPFNVVVQINAFEAPAIKATAKQAEKLFRFTSEPDWSQGQGYHRSGILIEDAFRDLAVECAKPPSAQEVLLERVAILKNADDRFLERVIPKKWFGLVKEVSVSELKALISKVEDKEPLTEAERSIINRVLGNPATRQIEPANPFGLYAHRVAALKRTDQRLLEEAIPKKWFGLVREISLTDLRALFVKVETNQPITDAEKGLIDRIFERNPAFAENIQHFGTETKPMIGFALEETHIPSLSYEDAMRIYNELTQGHPDVLNDFMRVLQDKNPGVFQRIQQNRK